jgi:hypothetical protein
MAALVLSAFPLYVGQMLSLSQLNARKQDAKIVQAEWKFDQFCNIIRNASLLDVTGQRCL